MTDSDNDIGKLLGGEDSALGEHLALITKLLADFVEAFRPVLPAIESLAPVVEPVVDALELANPEIMAVAEAFSVLAPVLKVLMNPLGALTSVVTGLAKALGSAISYVSAALLDLGRKIASNVVAPLVRGIAQAVTAFVQFSVSMSAANRLMTLAASGIQAITGSLTAGISALANAVTPFVQALNPNLINGLNYAMRGLQATIGVALQPVVQALIPAIRQIAGILLPAMQAVAPALGKLASALMTFVQGTFRIFADTLTMLAPVLDVLGKIANVLVGALDAIRAVVLAVADSLVGLVKSLFGVAGNIKDFLSAFRDGLHRVLEALLKFTVMLAKSLGLSTFQADLVRNLKDLAGQREGERKTGAPPAATDVAFRGFEDFAKTIAQSAFIAQGGGGVDAEAKSEREWLAKLADSLDQIKDGKAAKEYFAEFQKWLQGEAEAYSKKMGGWVEIKVDEWKEQLKEKAIEEVKEGWGAVQRWWRQNVSIPMSNMLNSIMDGIAAIPGVSWFVRR